MPGLMAALVFGGVDTSTLNDTAWSVGAKFCATMSHQNTLARLEAEELEKTEVKRRRSRKASQAPLLSLV